VPLISVDEAAKQVQRGRATIFAWIARGWLTPQKVAHDRRTFVDTAELMAARELSNRRPRAKPGHDATA
jgi:hypothetical protein